MTLRRFARVDLPLPARPSTTSTLTDPKPCRAYRTQSRSASSNRAKKASIFGLFCSRASMDRASFNIQAAASSVFTNVGTPCDVSWLADDSRKLLYNSSRCRDNSSLPAVVPTLRPTPPPPQPSPQPPLLLLLLLLLCSMLFPSSIAIGKTGGRCRRRRRVVSWCRGWWSWSPQQVLVVLVAPPFFDF